MEQLATSATEVRRGIDQKELQLVVDSAREANALIDQRTFSWTAFFNRIEANDSAGRDADVGAADHQGGA